MAKRHLWLFGGTNMHFYFYILQSMLVFFNPIKFGITFSFGNLLSIGRFVLRFSYITLLMTFWLITYFASYHCSHSHFTFIATHPCSLLLIKYIVLIFSLQYQTHYTFFHSLYVIQGVYNASNVNKLFSIFTWGSVLFQWNSFPLKNSQLFPFFCYCKFSLSHLTDFNHSLLNCITGYLIMNFLKYQEPCFIILGRHLC